MTQLLKGRFDSGAGPGPGPGPDPGTYPDAVNSAGAQVAWDIAPNGVVDTSKVGHRGTPVPITALNIPLGWYFFTGSGFMSIRTNRDNPDALIGFDTTGYAIWIDHDGIVIRDSRIWISLAATQIMSGILFASQGTSNVVDALVEYCTIDGLNTDVQDDRSSMIGDGLGCHGTAVGMNNYTLRNCIIRRAAGDIIKWRPGNSFIQRCYFERGGMAYGREAHWDTLSLEYMGPNVTIEDCFCNQTPSPNTFGRTSSFAIGTYCNGVKIRRCILGFGNDVLDNGYVDDSSIPNPGPFVGTWGPPVKGYYVGYSGFVGNENIEITNNVMEYGIGPIYSSNNQPYGIVRWDNNFRLSTGALIPPVYPLETAFYNVAGPYLRWQQEGALLGQFTAWQTKMSSMRLNNRLWTDTTANYGYGAALLQAFTRGLATADFDADAAAFINDYMADNPGQVVNEAHRVVWDMYFSYLLNRPNAAACLAWLNTIDTDTAHWMDDSGSPALNITNTDYRARVMAKIWDNAMVLRLIGNTDFDWTARTQTFRDACIANQNANGGWPAYPTPSFPNRPSKFFQDACICRSAMFYYDHFEQHAGLLVAIRKAAAHAWRCLVQKSGAGFLQNGQPYMDQFAAGDDWMDGNGSVQLGSADLLAQWFDVFGWLAYRDGDTTFIGRADTWMATWNTSAFLSTTNGAGIKNYDEAYATWSWRYSYWRGTTRNTTLKPRNTAVPTISGAATVGSLLTFNPGAWANGGSSTFELYRVKTGNVAGCGFIKLTPTSPTTYAPTSADLGCYLFIEETRTNASGDSIPAISAWTAAIT